MNNIKIPALFAIAVLLSLTIFQTVPAAEVGFKYGIIGKKSMQDRNLFIVEDGGEMRASEMIRINYSLEKPGYFYLIWRSPNGDFTLLTVSEKSDYLPGDIQKTDWYELDSECGMETLYLVASPERLLSLENWFNNLMSSGPHSQAEFHQKIAVELETYAQGSADKNSRLTARKEKPLDSGIVFRSAGINENSLRQELSGSGVQVKAFKIDHRK